MGKSASKLKKKRSQSIAWSFRFPSLGSLSRPRRMAPPAPPPPALVANSRPHLDVRQWLAVLDLTQYGPNFDRFSGVEELLSFSEEDIRSLGIRNSAHRARVVSSIVALRDKYEKGYSKRKEKLQRHSVAVDSSRLVHQNGTSDILVVSDAIQSKSLCNLVMDPSPAAASPCGGGGGDGAPASGGVTPVNAGGSGPGSPAGAGGGAAGAAAEAAAAADAAALRRALEWELSLDSRDLRSHAWYHGAIPRQRAEEIVAADGDFLVRDCTSQPGNFVLTCRSRGQPLHFVINKVVIQPDTVYERVQFQFEDDCYDTVPDLITFYVGSGKSISSMSGARIHTPRNRQFPLSFYASKYGLQQQAAAAAAAAAAGQAVSPLGSPLGAGAGTLRYNPYNSYRSPVHSPPRNKRETPPRLPSKKQRSHSLTPAEFNGRGGGMGVAAAAAAAGARAAAGGGVDERSNSADGVIQNSNGGGKFSTHSLPRSAGMSCAKTPSGVLGMGPLGPLGGHLAAAPHGPPAKSIVRVTSDPALSPCMERRRFGYMTTDLDEPDANLPDHPPPKPSRIPSLLRPDSKDGKEPECGFENGGSACGDAAAPLAAHGGAGTFQRGASYHASGSDSGNGSGDSAQSSAAGDAAESAAALPQHRGVVIKNPRYLCGHARRPSSGGSGSSGGGAGGRGGLMPALEYDSAAEDSLLLLAAPDPEPATAFDLENFVTLLLPSVENKPLDNSALQSLRMMLQETGPRVLANHLTRVDLELTAGGGMQASGASSSGWEADLGLGITCGLELCSLPHGRQLRLDLLERTECLKLLVAVTILTCTSEAERAEVLNKWIQVAIDTKTALGNLYGFCGIMMGLCMPQVQRLTSTWHVLRQKFTDSAFNFEAKLRPTLKSMNECSNPQAPNTTIPHLLPFILLQERSLDDILGTAPSSIMATSVLGSWESSTADFGLGTLYAHLEAARKFGESLPTFRRNAEIVLGDSKVDDLLLDAFRTEFHLKFLWGSRGAAVAPADRHAKFDQVLCVMSEKCEPPSPVHTPVGTAV